MANLSLNSKYFLSHIFNGDGKYYTTEAKSKTYGNTIFQNFYNKNTNLIEIIDSGNDAPRGGRTGSFVVVKFLPEFYAKYNSLIEDFKREEKEKELAEINKPIIKAKKIEEIKSFIEENKPMVCVSILELVTLKESGNKEEWQTKANALVNKVSKANFGGLKWSEIYEIVRNS